MMRAVCKRKGHKFAEMEIPLPYVFCRRWRCDASGVSRWAPPELAVQMHNAIPRENRFPPVELNPDGSIKEEW